MLPVRTTGSRCDVPLLNSRTTAVDGRGLNTVRESTTGGWGMLAYSTVPQLSIYTVNANDGRACSTLD